jgi:hypothetical protein
MLDKIATDPSRTKADYDYAEQVLLQHGKGMDRTTADAMFQILLEREESQIQARETIVAERRSALEAELATLTGERQALPTDANRFRLLVGAANHGQPLPDGAHDEICSAEGNPEAEAEAVAKYAGQLAQYEASLHALQT